MEIKTEPKNPHPKKIIKNIRQKILPDIVAAISNWLVFPRVVFDQIQPNS